MFSNDDHGLFGFPRDLVKQNWLDSFHYYRTLMPYNYLKGYAAPTIIMLQETSENLQARQHKLIYLSLKHTPYREKLFYYACVL